MNTKYLIIGNSAGGIGAAEAIHQIDRNGTLTMISDEPYPAYSRPAISHYLAGECLLEGMLFRPADFYEKNSINALLGQKGIHLDLAGRKAKLDNSQVIAWGKLLLATGGSPIVPAIKGSDRPGVFTFTTLDDAKGIRKVLDGVGQAVVIGGGLIGVSVAEALTKCGLKVVIVEMKDRVLNTILDERGSSIVAERLNKAGLRIVTGRTVSEIWGIKDDGAVKGVTLDNGEDIPCGLVVMAIGVTPRLELVKGSQMKLNRGIVVDHHMATSISGVYACGDVAEAYDVVYGANRLTPIWPNAYLGGKVAGSNMAGVEASYTSGTSMNSLNYFGLAMISAGLVTPPNGDYEVLSREYGQSYRKLVLKGDRLAGMVFVGDIEASGIFFNLLKDGVGVADFKRSLLEVDFGLACLPSVLREKRLGMPYKPPVSEPVMVSSS